MLEGEYGLSGVDPHPMRAALATFAAFLGGRNGVGPLMPFLLGLADAFAVSATLTNGDVLCHRGLESRWSLQAWWPSGLETFGIAGGRGVDRPSVVGTLFQA